MPLWLRKVVLTLVSGVGWRGRGGVEHLEEGSPEVAGLCPPTPSDSLGCILSQPCLVHVPFTCSP